jgi:hypothetical protein
VGVVVDEPLWLTASRKRSGAPMDRGLGRKDARDTSRCPAGQTIAGTAAHPREEPLDAARPTRKAVQRCSETSSVSIINAYRAAV